MEILLMISSFRVLDVLIRALRISHGLSYAMMTASLCSRNNKMTMQSQAVARACSRLPYQASPPMQIMKKSTLFSALLAASSVSFLTASASAGESQAPIKKEKLQIVFCFGQSNMVGLAAVPTAWYLTGPTYLPPKEVALQKTRFFDYNFYWSGVNYYEGPRKAELEALWEERKLSRMTWRQRINGVNGIEWDEAKWGKHPGKGRSNVEPFLDLKARRKAFTSASPKSSMPRTTHLMSTTPTRNWQTATRRSPKPSNGCAKFT
jgi:hypothetical protein